MKSKILLFVIVFFVILSIPSFAIPTYSQNSTNNTLAGQPTLFSLNWTDDTDLSGYIFQFCNGTWNGTYCLGQSQNWLTGWSYRKSHNIINATGADVNYTVQIIVKNATETDSGNTVYIKNKTRSDFGDVRFTNSTGSLLNYWIESLNTGDNATFWVQIDGNLTSINQTIYIYYGNSIATSESNGNITFPFFDDFPGTSLDTSKWSVSGTGTVTVANSKCNITSTASSGLKRIQGATSFGIGYEFRAYMREIVVAVAGETDWGFNTSWDSNAVEFYGYTPTRAWWNYFTKSSGSGTGVATSSIRNPNYHYFKVRRLNTTSARFQIDDGTEYEIITNIPSVNLPAAFVSRHTDDFIEVDWIFIREYVYPEPIHGVWTSEETPNSWVNDTWTSMTGATNWSNVTKVVNSTVGANIAWCVYANDTSNNWNRTSCNVVAGVSPFSLTTTSAAQNRSANVTQPISIISSVQIMSSFVRTVTGFFSTSAGLSKLLSLSKSITSSLTLNSISSRLSSLFKTLSQTLATNIISTRFTSILRPISNTFGITDSLTKTLLFFRSLIQSLSANTITSRFIGFYKGISGSFVLSESSTRITSLSRIVGETMSLNLIAIRFRTALIYTTNGVAITESITRIPTFSRILSQGIPITGMIIRTQTLIRIISQPISIGQIVKRIWIAYSKFFCFLMGDEESCASSGCYWCTGSCQAATCPTPVTPPPGGGGGWIYPAPVTPVVETVLDTEVHIETEQIVPGDRVYATITVLKVEGPRGVTNVNLTYWIKDTEGKIVGLKSTIVGIETTRRDIYYLTVPVGSPVGLYSFEVLAQYDSASDTASSYFNVLSELPPVLITINRIDVPLILLEENTTIKVVLESKAERQLKLNMTLFLPEGFEPLDITKTTAIDALTEDIFNFNFVPHVAGSFTGFIKIEYEDRKIVKDFNIDVYSPEKFYMYWIKIYWWLIAIIMFVILSLLIYKYRPKKKEIYVYRKEELYK
jgi:hypothetical protein